MEQYVELYIYSELHVRIKESAFDLSADTVSLVLQLRFVCMSDTHCLTSHLQFEIPYGDVFVHAGDFTRCGSASEVEEFNSWIGEIELR